MSMIGEIKQALKRHKRKHTKFSYSTINAHAVEWLTALVEYHQANEGVDRSLPYHKACAAWERLQAARKKLEP